ncbi:MAG: hypothetical protein ACTSU2_10450 [Promethearchaeota archaeon]
MSSNNLKLGKVKPWHPFDHPIITFMVVSPSGVPLIIYPTDETLLDNKNTPALLMSGLMTAINNFANELSGEDIENLQFGNFMVSISRDLEKNLYILMTDANYIKDISFSKQIHVELATLFQNYWSKLKYPPEELNNHKEEFAVVLDPLYKVLIKKIQKLNQKSH